MSASEAVLVAEKDAPASEEPAFARTWPATVRYPVLALTWLFLKPALWAIDKAGWSDPLWLAVGRRMRDTFIRGHDFGDSRPTGQQRVIDNHCRADLQCLGSDFPYDEVWDAASPVPVQPAAAEGV